jgi:hypothetical protein
VSAQAATSPGASLLWFETRRPEVGDLIEVADPNGKVIGMVRIAELEISPRGRVTRIVAEPAL